MRIIPIAPLDLPPAGKVLWWLTSILLWAALFTPLIVSSETIFPFQTGKGIAFRMLVEAAAFSYFCLCIINPKSRPRTGSLFWTVVVFVGVLLLTTVTSPSVSNSFWGNLERMEGAFGILHGAGLFVVAYGLFKRKEDWIRFFVVSLTASIFISLYAFAQLNSSFRFFPVHEPKEFQPGATLGHHSFVATYTIFQVFFGLFVAVMDRSTLWRVFGLSVSALNLIVFMLAAVRGAQLGMLAALGIGTVLALWYIVKHLKARIALAGMLVTGAALFFTILALKDSPLMNKLPYGIQRMSSISLDAWTARTRLLSLQISWEAFKERPILGWGQENFKVAYNRYFDPKHLDYEQAWFDRAHNKVAEVAVQSGIAGLLSYLIMFIAALAGLIRHLKKCQSRDEQMLALGVIMLGAAYFIQNLFLFDTSTSYLLFFSSLAYAGFLVLRTATQDAEYRQVVRSSERSSPSARQGLLAVTGIAILVLLVRFNWTSFEAARLGRAAVDADDAHRARTMLEEARESGGFATAEITTAVMEALINSGRSKQKEWVNVARSIEHHYDTMPAEELTDARILIRLGKLYNDRALADRSYLSKADLILQRAIALAPSRPEGYQELGVTNFLRGDGEKGEKLFREALVLNENNVRARWVLGLALASRKKLAEGLIELEKAITLGYDWDNPADIGNLTIVYRSMNMTEKLIRFYELVVERHPENADYRTVLDGINRMVEKTTARNTH